MYQVLTSKLNLKFSNIKKNWKSDILVYSFNKYFNKRREAFLKQNVITIISQQQNVYMYNNITTDGTSGEYVIYYANVEFIIAIYFIVSRSK